MATVELRYDPKDTAWFTANATMILKAGEPAYHETTGLFKLGDGTTQLSALPFLPATGGGGGGNFVPYTGATGDVDLGEYELKAGQIELDQSPTGNASVAVTRWNDTNGLTETTLKGGSVIIKNGIDLVARVVNKVVPNTTLTKAAYQVVKISGAQGQRLAVNLAQGNNDNNSADTLGIVIETIATNQEGFIMTVGQLEGINTTGSLQGETWNDGDVLYLSPTTPGAITKVKPNGSTGHIVVLGYVEYAHANNGKIYVKVMNGWELDELHNVYINAPADNDILAYENATSLWKNKSISTIASGFVPYTGANANVDLGNYSLTTSSINGVNGLLNFNNVAQASGAITNYTFTKPNNTNQTASTPIKGVLWTLGSRQWATGAINTQKEFELTTPTYSFTGVSTITNAYTLFVNASTAGTNATITNNYAAGFSGRVGQYGLGNSTYFGDLCGVKDDLTNRQNTAFGFSAANKIASGSLNVAIGATALFSNISGNNNVAIGGLTLYQATSNSNIGIGGYALYNLTSGQSNIAIGYDTGGGVITGGNNIFVGNGITGLPSNLNNNIILSTNLGVERFRYNPSQGSPSLFSFSPASTTSNLASTEINIFRVNAATTTLLTGALTTQRFFYLPSQTLAFASASTTTNVYGLYVESATAGTNATITNNFGIGCTNLYVKSNSTSTSNKALQIRNTAESSDFLYVRGDGLTFVGDVQVGNGLGSGTFHVYGNQGQTSDIVRIFSSNSVNIFEFRQSSNNALMYLRSSSNTLGVQLTGQSGGTNYIDGIVSIGSTTSVASAVMNVDSTTKGFLPPRMTTTQKNAISSPAAGLIVYDTTTNKACCYDGSIWNDLF